MARSRKRLSRNRRRRTARWARILGAAAAVAVLAGVATVGGIFWYYGQDLPDLSDLTERYRPPQVTRIESADGVLLGEIFDERRTVVPFERFPRLLVQAVLAAEDADFYQHEGLDYPGMIRALLVNLREGRIAQGASTITQQVVQTFYIGREKTMARKIRELLLARRLEQHLSKDQILFLYLNQINFGHARYGVQQAAQFYFGRNVEDITLAQAALLAGLPRGPTVYSPRSNPERALARRNWVLAQMEAKGFASPAAVEQARAEPVTLASSGESWDLAPEVLSPVRQRLLQIVGEENMRLGGYLVRTTVDSRLQRAARQAVQQGLEALDERHGYRGPLRQTRGRAHEGAARPGRAYVGRVTGTDDAEGTLRVQVGDTEGVVSLAHEKRYNPRKMPPSKFARKRALVRVNLRREAQGTEPAVLRLDLGPQAALVALEPGTGRVRALVGGYALRPGDFDRATQAQRQPGSSFKPFVYSLALNSREFTPASLIADAPEVFEQWRPTNFEEWSYEGHVRLRQALATSINMVAVRLIRDLGPDAVVEYVRRLGIQAPLEATPALALGASAVTPLEMVEAYAVFAGGGLHATPEYVEEILGPDRQPVPFEHHETERVIEEPEAYLIGSLLRSVVREGTGHAASSLGPDVAGKTGTSNDAQDAWFVGFVPGLACAVWVGFDEPRSLGRGESGSRSALPLWVQFMTSARQGQTPHEVERPEGVVVASIDPASGLLAYEGQETTVEEEFLDGTVPTERAIPPDAADPSTFLMEQTAGEPGPTAPAGDLPPGL